MRDDLPVRFGSASSRHWLIRGVACGRGLRRTIEFVRRRAAADTTSAAR